MVHRVSTYIIKNIQQQNIEVSAGAQNALVSHRIMASHSAKVFVLALVLSVSCSLLSVAAFSFKKVFGATSLAVSLTTAVPSQAISETTKLPLVGSETIMAKKSHGKLITFSSSATSLSHSFDLHVDILR